MHHLVREHVLKALVVAGEVEEHAMAQGFGHAARAFTQVAGDIVLSEVVARLEQHDRLFLSELVIEYAR